MTYCRQTVGIHSCTSYLPAGTQSTLMVPVRQKRPFSVAFTSGNAVISPSRLEPFLILRYRFEWSRVKYLTLSRLTPSKISNAKS